MAFIDEAKEKNLSKAEQDEAKPMRGGRIISGGGEQLHKMWCIVMVYHLYEGGGCPKLQLESDDHISSDPKSFASLFVGKRIHMRNEPGATEFRRLLRVCSKEENDFLNHWETHHAEALAEMRKNPDRWPLYDLTLYKIKPKRHELLSLSLGPPA